MRDMIMKMRIHKLLTRAFTAMMMTAAASAVSAQDAAKVMVSTADCHCGTVVDKPAMKRQGDYMGVEMCIMTGMINVPSTQAVLLTPRLVNGNDSIDLPSVGIYGRRRYYDYVREGHGSLLTGSGETTYMASKRPVSTDYNSMVEYSPWMDGAVLKLVREDYGCCGTLLGGETLALVDNTPPAPEPVVEKPVYVPQYVYVTPKVETRKSRSLSGQAFIDFPVNKTDILEDYRGNAAELTKIRATIDSVHNDRDITVTSLSIKGYASPEGSYANNDRLAAGRTEALKRYVMRLYNFAPSIIHTTHEAEDWAGLRRFVEQTDALVDRDAILELIDGEREADNKEWMIKSRHKDDYAYLKEVCYPALRHSDYRVEYVIRGFGTIEEIRNIYATAPQKLSLHELYLLAQTMEPGSREFDDVWETAVRLFPDDEAANINGANTAMKRGDMVTARARLAKAGSSPEAEHARTVLAGFSQ